MDFVSTRLITGDLARLVDFYEVATEGAALWSTPDFAELVTPTATLAMGSTRTVALFAEGAARAVDNRSVIIEFHAEDVDAVHRRLAARDVDVVQSPTSMPWGNRSLLVRDPDGNLVNFFTPTTPEAAARLDAERQPRRAASS
jgi:uncharacterized glyoxalase superfamily protein PhnB